MVYWLFFQAISIYSLPYIYAQSQKSFLSSSLIIVSQPNNTGDSWDPVKIIEYTGSIGTFVSRQELFLPCTNTTCFTRNSCGYVSRGTATLSWDGTTLLLAGENVATGANLSVGLTAPRVIAEMNSRGILNMTMFMGCMANGQTANTCGVTDFTHPVSVAGIGTNSSGWFVNCRSPGNALLYVNRSGSFVTVSGSISLTPGILLTTSYTINATIPQVFVTGTSGTQRSVFQIGSSINNAMQQGSSVNYLSGSDVSQRSGFFTDTAYAVGLFVASPTQIFLCLANTIVGGNGVREITRWSATSSNWNVGRLFNMGQPCSSLTGRREAGVMMLYATSCMTMNGCTNALYQINADIGAVLVVATPPAGTVFSSVSLPPCDSLFTTDCATLVNGIWTLPVSSMISASRTATPSANASKTMTQSTSATMSYTSLLSSSATVSATVSSMASISAPASKTITATSSASKTTSATSYPSKTTSVSGSATIRETPSQFGTLPWNIYDIVIRVPAQSEEQIKDPMSFLDIRINVLCSLNTVSTVWIKEIRPVGSYIQPYTINSTDPVNMQPYSCQTKRTLQISSNIYDVYIVLEVNVSKQAKAKATIQPIVGIPSNEKIYEYGFIAGSVCILCIIIGIIVGRRITKLSHKRILSTRSPLHSHGETKQHEKEKEKESAFRNTFKPTKVRK